MTATKILPNNQITDLATFKYLKVHKNTCTYLSDVKMALKNINLSIPENLLKEAQHFADDFGYRNVQELLLDLLRSKLMNELYLENKRIEDEMDRGINVKKMSQEEAIEYFKNL